MSRAASQIEMMGGAWDGGGEGKVRNKTENKRNVNERESDERVHGWEWEGEGAIGGVLPAGCAPAIKVEN